MSWRELQYCDQFVVEQQRVRFEDATDLWGLDAIESCHRLRERFGPDSASLVIGPAGEKLVRFAAVRSDAKSAAGRTGLGAVMGSKRIKGIVVITSNKNQDSRSELIQRLEQQIHNTGVARILRKYGTPYLYDFHYLAYKALRVCNGTRRSFQGGRNLLSSVLSQKFLRPARSCPGCSIGCRHQYSFQGANGLVTGAGPEYALIGLLGAGCGISSLEWLLFLNDRLNRLGLDISTTVQT